MLGRGAKERAACAHWGMAGAAVTCSPGWARETRCRRRRADARAGRRKGEAAGGALLGQCSAKGLAGCCGGPRDASALRRGAVTGRAGTRIHAPERLWPGCAVLPRGSLSSRRRGTKGGARSQGGRAAPEEKQLEGSAPCVFAGVAAQRRLLSSMSSKQQQRRICVLLLQQSVC